MKVSKAILALLLILVVISAISLTSIKTVSAQETLMITISTDKSVYTTGEVAHITFYATSGGKPIPGADIMFTLIHDGKPGMTYNAWATDSEGKSIEHWGGSALTPEIIGLKRQRLSKGTLRRKARQASRSSRERALRWVRKKRRHFPCPSPL